MKEISNNIGKIKFHDIEYDKEKQKELLGEFYKEGVDLPIFRLDNNTMLDFPRFAFVKELKENWKAPESYKNITFLGVSGSILIYFLIKGGKTHRILSYGIDNYLILFSVTEPSTSEQKNIDYSIKSFMKKIKENIKDNENEKNTKFATNLTNSLILSRLLYLIYLFQNNNNLKPKQFLIWQLNGNSNYSNYFFGYIYENIKENLEKYIKICIKILNEILKGKKLSFALDEAHIFEALFAFRNEYY